jgi:Na+-transporting NADH:ubiquinone oxidoreductase subunit NqrF
MSFKFKIGDKIVPTLAKEMGIPVGPSEVTAIQLGGYVQIEPVGTGAHRRELVEAKYYERFEEEAEQPDN